MRSALFFTPPQLAELLGTNERKILSFIASGELPAHNIALHPGKRPRWRISSADFEAFLQRRRTSPSPARPARKRKQAGNVIEFY